MQGAPSHTALAWMQACGCSHPTAATGLAYDVQDELLSGVLRLREPSGTIAMSPEMMFYLPTPARQILRLITISALSETR